MSAPETVPAKTAEAKPPAVAPSSTPHAATTPKVAAGEDQPAPAPVKRPDAPAARAAKPDRPVTAEMRRQGDSLRLYFPFAAATPAAVFQRADTLWLVFDTKVAIDIGLFSNDQSKTIHSAALTRDDDAPGGAAQA